MKLKKVRPLTQGSVQQHLQGTGPKWLQHFQLPACCFTCECAGFIFASRGGDSIFTHILEKTPHIKWPSKGTSGSSCKPQRNQQF